MAAAIVEPPPVEGLYLVEEGLAAAVEAAASDPPITSGSTMVEKGAIPPSDSEENRMEGVITVKNKEKGRKKP